MSERSETMLSKQHGVDCLANQRYNASVEGKAGLCDVYLPKSDPPPSGWPAVVVVHGGAWISGDKWTLEGYSRLLARHGIVVVTINYRLAPKHKFPCQVDDVRQSLIWTAKQAQKLNIDLSRLGMFGYSAGGHLASLIGVLQDEPAATQRRASKWAADDPRWQDVPSVSAVCAGGPPCDFRDMPIDNTTLAYFLGGSRRQKPAVYRAASPTAHASAADPVMQFIHGETDLMVPISSSRSLYQALKAAGADVRFKVVSNQGHMMTFINMQTRQDVLEFFQSVFVRPQLSNWDMRSIGRAPSMSWLSEASPIRELIYRGQRQGDNPTDVFAFYATPGTISGDSSKDKNLPAVVLIHGGGGTAFADWVWLWAKRGYAAIAMDLSGRRPESPVFRDGELVSNMRVKRERLPRGGPEQGHGEKFASVGGSVTDDWPYHAVGNAIRAHSLIRSFPEVDAERTAVTGISWGGYTTCIVASVDDRFKAAAPVYGCGFLYDGESVQRSLIDRLSADQRQQWIRQYDPASHLRYCSVPVLFVNGTNDKHYPLRSYSRSFRIVPGEKQIRIEPRMAHGHQPGWKPNEIGWFFDAKLNANKELPRLGAIQRVGGNLQAAFTSDVPLKSAALNFTVDDGKLLRRTWQQVPAEMNADLISAAMPNATVAFFTVTDERGAMVSTDVLFSETN